MCIYIYIFRFEDRISQNSGLLQGRIKFSKGRFAARFFPTRSAEDESSPDEFQFVGRKEYFREGGRKETRFDHAIFFEGFLLKSRAFAFEKDSKEGSRNRRVN